jgi:hypothetical protein
MPVLLESSNKSQTSSGKALNSIYLLPSMKNLNQLHGELMDKSMCK